MQLHSLASSTTRTSPLRANHPSFYSSDGSFVSRSFFGPAVGVKASAAPLLPGRSSLGQSNHTPSPGGRPLASGMDIRPPPPGQALRASSRGATQTAGVQHRGPDGNCSTPKPAPNQTARKCTLQRPFTGPVSRPYSCPAGALSAPRNNQPQPTHPPYPQDNSPISQAHTPLSSLPSPKSKETARWIEPRLTCCDTKTDDRPHSGERQADAGPAYAPPGRVGRHGRRREQGAQPLCRFVGAVPDAEPGQEDHPGRCVEASFLYAEGASVGA